MKRRINNLHKGMFKGNKTSNIIELHSKKRPDKSKENENINISQYKYNNEINKNNIESKNYEQKMNINQNKKEKLTNIYNDTFSDSDSSHNKSIIKTKLYNKYAKSGTYFKKLRQQVIDKFISGKPLISIERMYNNPEVKKMFGVQNNTERTNYNCNSSYKKDEEDFISLKEERDRRIPPSKFIPMQNIYNNMNNMNIQYNDGFNNINNINNINDTEQSNDFNNNNINTMNKINQNYYRYKMQNQIQNSNNNINALFQNNNKNNTYLYNQQKNYNMNNDSLFMNTNDSNNRNEYDGLQEINKEFRRKRKSNNDNRNNCLIKLSGINEEINNEYNEKEDINNLLNNLKNANNESYNDTNIYLYENRDNDSYFNNLLINKDKENNFINYFKKNKKNIENSEMYNDIRFDTPSKHFNI